MKRDLYGVLQDSGLGYSTLKGLKGRIPPSILIPYAEDDQERYGRLKNNTVYRADIKKPRNPRHHKLMWAFFRAVSQNKPDQFPTEESVELFIKIKLKMFEAWRVVDGVMHIKYKSISYEDMDEIEFSDFCNQALPHLADELDCTVKDLKENYKQYLSGIKS
jgi:hypothetical protein